MSRQNKQMQTVCKARENPVDQIAIGFNFSFDWLKKRLGFGDQQEYVEIKYECNGGLLLTPKYTLRVCVIVSLRKSYPG